MNNIINPVLTAFPAISRADATVLILGSMPGVASLKAQRYYAHPQNAFWFIMSSIYGNHVVPDSYTERVRLIKNAGVAIWDVLMHCKRPGSLDSKIDPKSVECNDFNAFLKTHRSINRIAFNGKTAEQLFRRHVLAGLAQQLHLVSLPSSSPAMATMNRQQKAAAWQSALNAS